MAMPPRKKAPYGTVEYYRGRIARWRQELGFGRFRRGPLAGQPYGPDRTQRLRNWIKDDHDKLIEAFANRRAAAGDLLALKRIMWVRYVRRLRSEAERLVDYAKIQQRKLERIEDSLRVGAPSRQAYAKRYAPSTLKSLAVHQRRARKAFETTLTQIARLPSKAPIPYREWSRAGASSAATEEYRGASTP